MSKCYEAGVCVCVFFFNHCLLFPLAAVPLETVWRQCWASEALVGEKKRGLNRQAAGATSLTKSNWKQMQEEGQSRFFPDWSTNVFTWRRSLITWTKLWMTVHNFTYPLIVLTHCLMTMRRVKSCGHLEARGSKCVGGEKKKAFKNHLFITRPATVSSECRWTVGNCTDSFYSMQFYTILLFIAQPWLRLLECERWTEGCAGWMEATSPTCCHDNGEAAAGGEENILLKRLVNK